MNPSNSSTDEELELLHYWFKTWPDQGVPYPNLYVNYIQEIYSDIIQNGGTTLIHCSAGIGRTGIIYITLLLMIRNKFSIRLIDGYNLCMLGSYKRVRPITAEEIEHLIIEARTHVRPRLIQTIEQYQFLCDVFGAKTTPDLTKNIWDRIVILPNGLSTSKQIVASASDNKDKNRYRDILPYDSNYYHKEDIPYVNASLSNIDGYDFILTQCPKPNTFDDFWKMVKYENVKRIIMVTGLIEGREGRTLKCDKYFKLDGANTNHIANLKLNYLVTKEQYEIRQYSLS